MARRLLSREASGSDDPRERIAAGERLFAGLRVHLAFWLGADGLEALLRRSIDRAGIAGRPPTGRTPLAADASAFDAIVTMVRAAPPEEGAEQVEMILTTFIGLLSHLVGQEIAQRLVEQSRSHKPSPNIRGPSRD